MSLPLLTKQKIRVPSAFKELFEPHRYKVYWGGRGAGKSVQIASALLLKGSEPKPKRILCAREIQRSIRDSVHSLLAQRIKALGLEHFYEVTSNEIRGTNGTSIIFSGLWQNVQSIKSIDGIDICWIEEGNSVSEQSWRTLIPSIRKPSSEIWVSFNPELKSDAAYQRFVLNPPDSAIVKKVSWRDNPYFHQTTLPDEMQTLKANNEEEYQHVYEGELKELRVCNLPVESVPVNTFWDLGRNDTTAIWFHQQVGKEHRFIDFYEHRLVDLDHYAHVLQDKGYLYGDHYLPHDVEAVMLGSGNRSRREILEGLGVQPIVTVPRIASVEDGIAQVRDVFRSCWFDQTDCEEGLNSLANYQYQWDDKFDTFRKVPLHNWASNGADAFRMFAQAYQAETTAPDLEFTSEW
jgi:phage terminase large subunit